MYELKFVVPEFIHQIKKIDFSNKFNVKMLYANVKKIETHLENVDYIGKPLNVKHLLEAIEKLDKKMPVITIVRIPEFRAVISGFITFEELFDGDFNSWQEEHNYLFIPVIFDCPDFFIRKR